MQHSDANLNPVGAHASLHAWLKFRNHEVQDVIQKRQLAAQEAQRKVDEMRAQEQKRRDAQVRFAAPLCTLCTYQSSHFVHAVLG